MCSRNLCVGWTHGAAGNMTLSRRPDDESDANDALICVYEAWNRLVAVHDDDDADGGNATPSRRIRKP